MLIYLALLERPEDEVAFIEMHSKYLSTLMGVGMSLCGNRWIVEDALQDTWMEVAIDFVKISSIPCHKTAAYLATIMRNNCMDILRKEGKYTELTQDESEGIDDIHSEVQTKDEYQRLIKQIRALPDIYREVLERRLVLDEHNKETAVELSISESLVAKRFERGLTKLRDALRKEEQHADNQLGQ